MDYYFWRSVQSDPSLIPFRRCCPSSAPLRFRSLSTSKPAGRRFSRLLAGSPLVCRKPPGRLNWHPVGRCTSRKFGSADRLRVDFLSLASFPDFVTRGFRGGAGCGPQPRSPAHGGSRPPSSADRSAAVGQASQTDSSRPVAMGDTGRILAGLAISTGDRPTGDGHLMAPERVSPVLDVEVASGTSGASGRFGRNAPTDSHDEP